MIRIVLLLLALSVLPAGAQSVTSQSVDTTITVIFYVKEGTSSPYQGMLRFTPAEFSALSPSALQALQLSQYEKWRTDTVAAQAAQAAQENSVPVSITAAQARRAILDAGLKDAVEHAVSLADPATQALWYTTETLERNNPILNALASQLGLSSGQVDDLFRAGRRL